jgi:hypothetical protein
MINTAELTGALLDYWVARAEGSTDAMVTEWSRGPICLSSHNAFEDVPFRPSTHWNDGGPLIEKYSITVDSTFAIWAADIGDVTASGDTPLQAICRAVVRAKFGDEVEDVPC